MLRYIRHVFTQKFKKYTDVIASDFILSALIICVHVIYLWDMTISTYMEMKSEANFKLRTYSIVIIIMDIILCTIGFLFIFIFEIKRTSQIQHLQLFGGGRKHKALVLSGLFLLLSRIPFVNIKYHNLNISLLLIRIITSYFGVRIVRGYAQKETTIPVIWAIGGFFYDFATIIVMLTMIAEVFTVAGGADGTDWFSNFLRNCYETKLSDAKNTSEEEKLLMADECLERKEERFMWSFYFVTVTLTSTGFGDITPSDAIERVVLICEMFIFMFFTTIAFSNIVAIVSTDTAFKEQTRNRQYVISNYLQRRIHITKDMVNLLSKHYALQEIRSDYLVERFATSQLYEQFKNNSLKSYRFMPNLLSICLRHTRRRFLFYELEGSILIIIIFFTVVLSMIYSKLLAVEEYISGWTTSQVLYFIIVTATSLGYGDLTPTSSKETILTITLIITSFIVYKTALVLFSNATLTNDSLLASYNEKMLTVRTLLRDVSKQRFEQVVVCFQLRWLLNQDLDLSPSNLCKYMDGTMALAVNQDFKRIIKSINYFHYLRDDLAAKMILKGEVLVYAPNEIIISEGEYDFSLYVIINGQVGLRDSANASAYTARRTFGAVAFVEKTPHLETVVALDISEVLRIKASDVEDVLRRMQTVNYRLKVLRDGKIPNAYEERNPRRIDESHDIKHLYNERLKSRLMPIKTLLTASRQTKQYLAISVVLARYGLILVNFGQFTIFANNIFSCAVTSSILRFLVVYNGFFMGGNLKDIKKQILRHAQEDDDILKYPHELWINLLLFILDVVSLITVKLNPYQILLYIVGVAFNIAAINFFFNQYMFIKVESITTINVLKTFGMLCVAEYCCACVLFAVACPTLLLNWNYVEFPIVDDCFNISSSSEDPHSRVIRVRDSDHLCFTFSWMIHQKDDVSYGNICTWKSYEMFMYSIYFATITTTTIGFGEVSARSISEQFVCMLMGFFGMLFFAYISALITSFLVNVESQESAWRQKMFVRSRHLELFNVPRELVVYMKQSFNYRWRMTRGQDFLSVVLDLNPYLRGELCMDNYKHYISQIKGLKRSSNAIQKMISVHMRSIYYCKQSYILKQWDLIDEVMILKTGEVYVEKQTGEKLHKSKGDILADYVDTNDGVISLVSIRASSDCHILAVRNSVISDALNVIQADQSSKKSRVRDHATNGADQKSSSKVTSLTKTKSARMLLRRPKIVSMRSFQRKQKASRMNRIVRIRHFYRKRSYNIFILRISTWGLAILSPLQIIFVSSNDVLVWLINACLVYQFLELLFVSNYSYFEGKALVFRTLTCLIACIPVEYINARYFDFQKDSNGNLSCDSVCYFFKIISVAYLVLFRACWLLFREKEISLAIINYLTKKSVLIDLVQAFVIIFLYHHVFTIIMFICSCAPWETKCYKDSLVFQKILGEGDKTPNNRLTLYQDIFYYIIVVSTTTGYGDYYPTNWSEIFLTILIALASQIFVGYMMGKLSSFFAFSLNAKINYDIETKRLQIELSRLAMGKSLTEKIIQYCKLGWNYSEGLDMKALYDFTPASLNADEKRIMYDVFLQNIGERMGLSFRIRRLNLPKIERLHIAQAIYRHLSSFVEEQLLLTGDTIVIKLPPEYFAYIKMGILQKKAMLISDQFLENGMYEAKTTCLVLRLSRTVYNDFLNLYHKKLEHVI